MFDNFYTKYEDAKIFISEANADEVALELEKDLKARKMTAEKFAYLSKAYVFKQDTKTAIKYAKEAIKKDKNYAYGYIRLAFAYGKSGNKKETLKNTQLAEKLSEDNFLFRAFLVIFYSFCDENEKSKEIFKDLIENYDESAPYAYNIGFLYDVVFKDYEMAAEYYQKAFDLDYKDKFNLCKNLADCYSELEDLDNAKFFVNRCLEIKQTEDILEKQADCYAYEGDFAQAKQIVRQLYKTTENKAWIAVKMAKIYIKAEEPEKAFRFYNLALKNAREEQLESLYNIIANSYEKIGEYEEAIKYYARIVNFVNKKDSSAYSSISYCYSQLEKYEQAYDYVEKALKYDNESSYIHYRKARVLTNMKKYEEAIQSFTDSLDYDKTDLDCYQWISYCYSMLKDYEKSLEFANRAIMLDKEDSYSYFRKAWAYQELMKYNEAIEFYKECIAHNDKYIDAYVNISYIYSKTGDMKQSLLWANKAILIDKDYAYAHYRKAWVFQETGKFEEALDGYSKAIELDPADVYNYLGIACISLNTQANLNALLYANKAIMVDRNCGGAYYYKSLALSNLGKIKEAEKAFSTAVELGYLPG